MGLSLRPALPAFIVFAERRTMTAVGPEAPGSRSPPGARAHAVLSERWKDAPRILSSDGTRAGAEESWFGPHSRAAQTNSR